MPAIVDKSLEQEDAEAEVEEFREDLGPFVVAAETSRMAMIFTDAKAADNPIIFANDSFLELTGYTRDETLGQPFHFVLAEGTPGGQARHLAQFVSDNHSTEVLCKRKSGDAFWSALFVSQVADEQGDLVQHFASFVDLTEHKNDEADSRMLINELNHRVKNTLATVQSIVHQAVRTATEPEAIRESIESRIFALSRSHDLLSRENWKSAGLHDVVTAAMEPFGVTNGRAERFKITGNNHRFPPKAVLALSIAFNELATNAVKYGAFSNEAGRILISWTLQPSTEGERLVLLWEEVDGPPVVPPSRKGFGSRVIERGLAVELEGTVDLDYRPHGVVCTINIPADQSGHHG